MAIQRMGKPTNVRVHAGTALQPFVLALCLMGMGGCVMAADLIGTPAGADVATTVSAAGMQPLNDTELAGATGTQGILLDIGLRNNVDAANNPIGCTPVITPAPDGTPNPCRLGLQFVARTTFWLMFKEFYGTLKLKDIQMDVAFLPTINSGFRNVTRFQDGAGACLIPLVGGICTPEGYFALGFRYPQLAARAAGTYADVTSFLNIGRIALEQNNGAVQGYMRDTSLSAPVALRMSDSGSINGAAQMRFDGNAYVYGF